MVFSVFLIKLGFEIGLNLLLEQKKNPRKTGDSGGEGKNGKNGLKMVKKKLKKSSDFVGFELALSGIRFLQA